MNIADPLAQQKAPAGEHGAETGTKQHITQAETDVNGTFPELDHDPISDFLISIGAFFPERSHHITPNVNADAGSVQTITIESVYDIAETPENWTIYRRPDESDRAFQDLCESILAVGITTPLEISSDRYVISGHRRLVAAIKCGLTTIPCLMDASVVMRQLKPTERVKLLIERNRGTRIKTDSESYLEAAASVDPEAAIAEAQARKLQVFAYMKTSNMDAVFSTGSTRRTDPSGERREMLNAVIEILRKCQNSGYLPTSGRGIHYKLLQAKVRTSILKNGSTRKNGYIYGTRPGSDGLLSKLLTDARSAGLIDHSWLDDGTRPSSEFEPDGTVGQFIAEQLKGIFSNYFSNIHADQPDHVEILVEKNTIYPLIKRHVANVFRLPITSLRGYGSFPAARDVAERFKRSGKGKLIVIYLSDLDPEGIDMPKSWKKYCQHDFGVNAEVFRAAVTLDQVERHHLPPDIDVKLSSSRAKGFIKEFGNQCWELDSMPEKILIEEVSNAVRAVLDIDILNKAFEREKQSDIRLAQFGAQLQAFARDHFKGAA